MNIKHKNENIQLILRAFGIQFIPLMIFAGLSKIKIISENSILVGILTLIVLGFLIYGYFPFIKACCRYIQSKGYSTNWGWLGLLSMVGLFILSTIPPKTPIIFSEDLSEEQLLHSPFDKLNLIEIFLFYFIGSWLTVYIFAYSLFRVNHWDYSELSKNIDTPIEYLIVLFVVFFAGLPLLRDLKMAGFKIKDFIPNLKISWKLTAKIALVYCIFTTSFGRLINYSLSFIFPDYIEKLINYNNSQDFMIGVFLLSIAVGIISTLFVYMLIYGILLQKWSFKWGNKQGILLLVFLYFLISLIDFRPSFFLDILGIIVMCLLFFKTANLLDVIIYGVFTELTFTISRFVFYSKDFNFPSLSIIEYREKHDPFLILYAILGVISFILIINFVRENFPKQSDMIPYYKNRNL